MIKYEVGDIVRLKSGGPAMTVCCVQSFTSDSDTISVTWFDLSEQVVSAIFNSRALSYACKSRTND